VRKADIGIAVSVAPGAATALIADNVITDFRPRAAIVGMTNAKAVTATCRGAASRATPT